MNDLNFGMSHAAGEGRDEALGLLAEAVQARPQEGQLWFDYISALNQAGQAEAAWQILAQARRLGLEGPMHDPLRQAILQRRGDGPSISLGDLYAQGRYSEFAAIVRCLLLEMPAQASLWSILGGALYELKRLPDALCAMRRAIELEPGELALRYSLAEALWETRQFADCRSALEEILALDPAHFAALGMMGAVLNALGFPEEALAAFDRAEAIAPPTAEMLNNKGNSHLLLNRLAEAETLYHRALELDPTFGSAHSNLGNIRLERNDLRGAEIHYRQAIALQPAQADLHVNLAEGLRRQSRYAEAEACGVKAVELDAGLATAHQLRGALSSYLSDHALVVSESDQALALGAPETPAWEIRLYTFSYHPDLAAEAIYREFVRWGDRFPDPGTDFSAHDRTPGRRLKIGYVSPDFRKHTSRFFFMPLMAHHDHQAFETFAYANIAVEDEHTAAFRQVFDQWRDIRGLSDEAAARMVREDGIDILVDCCNHMKDDRLDVFALKPAPIQVTWLGAAWTTGLKAIDYVLFDPYIAPEGTIARETIVRLPNCFVAYRPPETTAQIAPLPARRNGHVSFGYSGRTERLNRHTFGVWGEILRRIPGARLILDYTPFRDPPTQAHYRALMAAHGLDPERVDMRWSADIFEGLGDIDILLDSFPHSGGTMLFDGLWMGVPALTLKSRPPLGRIGTTLMTNLGMTDWVAETEADYVGKAVAFAADLEGLTTIRVGLRDRMRASPLMDETGFAKGVENAYRTMWDRWLQAP